MAVRSGFKVVLIYLAAFFLATANIACGRMQVRIVRGGPTNVNVPNGEKYQVTLESGSAESTSLSYSSFVTMPRVLEVVSGDPGLSAVLTVGAETCSYVDVGGYLELDSCTSQETVLVDAGTILKLSVAGTGAISVKAVIELEVE